MTELSDIREHLRQLNSADEANVIDALKEKYGWNASQRERSAAAAAELVRQVRAKGRPGIMESFLFEYGLSSDEGVALMCLAEALLRVPDAQTKNALIEDKITSGDWFKHVGQSSSFLVNMATRALGLTSNILSDKEKTGLLKVLNTAIKRAGLPVIRTAVSQAMKIMANYFVLGETIQKAQSNGRHARKMGMTFSYDMLGEAAITDGDARKYLSAYEKAIESIRQKAKYSDPRDNPGISIKLSALHPRYETRQKSRVMSELVARVLPLCLMAKEANIGLNIDAEEADRLELSLDVIEAVLSDERLASWEGFGVVVQAYSKRASAVIDWLYVLATRLDRRIMVRLVKGAYWDTEIKRAQVEGLESYPVFTRKSATDVSFLCCAKQLLSYRDRIYSQFATHNAHSVAAILALNPDKDDFEFQRLHGMGDVLHDLVKTSHGTRCRIYAPVGFHKDLLAYLVRRLLENGANSSFVNQIVDDEIAPEKITQDPFQTYENENSQNLPSVILPKDIYVPERINSVGWDVQDYEDLRTIDAGRAPFKMQQWHVGPIIAGHKYRGKDKIRILNPADPSDVLGTVTEASQEDVDLAIKKARVWTRGSAAERAVILNKAADLYEENFGLIFAVLTREAGKVLPDAVAELREAVDFLRYYAAQVQKEEFLEEGLSARGIISCISPWNFPLAIFTGQIAAALAAGNGVLAKPAEPTVIIASIAVQLLHKAGVPKDVLQLLPGAGRTIGARIVADEKVDGVCFTGSTQTAQIINKFMAQSLDPFAPLIAETGGLNAMIVDSTALPEQAVSDIVASAFQSAGQRCSALRVVYIQADIAPTFSKMLFDAVKEQSIGNPWDFAADIGPIINDQAQAKISHYIDAARSEGRLMFSMRAPETGSYVGPAVIAVEGIQNLGEEIFGPVLHLATFKAHQIDDIIADINNSGYGLTFGLHSRIDNRVQHLSETLRVGNVYVNRNQIGAVVGTQPFGGEGLSGTGPKAGGPHYVKRFTTKAVQNEGQLDFDNPADVSKLQNLISSEMINAAALSTRTLPGPTGELNALTEYPKGVMLCLGPKVEQAMRQAEIVRAKGCAALIICEGAEGGSMLDGVVLPETLETLKGIAGVIFWGQPNHARKYREALSRREGAILPLIGQVDIESYCVSERHLCVDVTASGGNVELLSQI